MNIICYQNDENLKNQYFDLVSTKYESLKNFNYFFDDLKQIMRFSLSEQKSDFLAVVDKENMLAHIAIIYDPQLPTGKAFWGFFESQNDKDTFNLLWEKAKEVARGKGINQLLGPINGSVWHQYRFVKKTDNSPFFKTELLCESFYYNLIKETGSKEISYYSAHRTDFHNLITITEPFYKKMLENGFSIIESTQLTKKQLSDILQLCKKAFNKSWGYTELSKDNFALLYPPKKLALNLNKVYFLQKNQEIIGYCSLLIEDSETLILKTIAILPEFQNLGLANALIYKTHINARDKQYKKIIYALIKEDNAVKRLPNDNAVVFRRYSTFESNI